MRTSFHSPALSRLAIVALAVAGTSASFAATTTPAYAQPSSGYYQAQLAAPLDRAETAIQNGVVWKCVGADCSAGKGNSRADVVCARLARKLGPVTAFVAGGDALDTAALAKCNGEKAAPLARR